VLDIVTVRTLDDMDEYELDAEQARLQAEIAKLKADERTTQNAQKVLPISGSGRT